MRCQCNRSQLKNWVARDKYANELLMQFRNIHIPHRMCVMVKTKTANDMFSVSWPTLLSAPLMTPLRCHMTSVISTNVNKSFDLINSKSNLYSDDKDDDDCWTCHCGFSNYGFRGDCFQCKSARPSSISNSNSNDDNMICENKHNDAFEDNEEENVDVNSDDEERENVNVSFNNIKHKKGFAADNTRSHDIRPSELITKSEAQLHSINVHDYNNSSDIDNGEGIVSSASKMFQRGDWLCSCKTHNFAKRIRCIKCGKTRSRNDPTEWSIPHSERKRRSRRTSFANTAHYDYSDSQFTSNNTSHTNQSHGIEANSHKVQVHNFLPGDWLCASCNMHNFCNRDVCRQCGRSRHSTIVDVNTDTLSSSSSSSLSSSAISPSDLPQALSMEKFSVNQRKINSLTEYVAKEQTWICSACSAHNSLLLHKLVCPICGTERDLSHLSGSNEEQNYDDSNNEMEFDELDDANVSVAQDDLSQRETLESEQNVHLMTNKQVELSVLPSLSFHKHTITNDKKVTTMAPFGVHDWTCGTCGFVNFGSRITCKRCLKPKPGSGERNKWTNVFVNDMWACKCGYLNYATRATCRECNKPKWENTKFMEFNSVKKSINDHDGDHNHSGNSTELR